MRKFLLSLLVFLLFFAFGHPVATEAREKKSAAARHSRVERRKKTAKSPRQTAVAHRKKVTRAEKAPAAEANGLQVGAADLESIMIHLERK